MEGLDKRFAAMPSFEIDDAPLNDRVKSATTVVHKRNTTDPRHAHLLQTIEREIIPRLVLARRTTAAPPSCALEGWTFQGDHVTAFARLVLTQEAPAVMAHLEALRARGVAVERLYLDLLTPTARYLGELWSNDFCTFAEVTVGLSRLQRALHALRPAFEDEVAGRRAGGHRILLATVPGEQHTFGVFMVSEFFRRAGWEVISEPGASTGDLVALVRAERYAVIGLSISCETMLGTLASCIRALRRASRNRSVGIMVGGAVFVEQPGRAPLVGADAMAVDGQQAVLQAQGLLELLAPP